MALLCLRRFGSRKAWLLWSLLYVADTGNHLVRRVDLRRHIVETVAGTGEQAREFNIPGTGRGVPLNSPWDLHGTGHISTLLWPVCTRCGA